MKSARNISEKDLREVCRAQYRRFPEDFGHVPIDEIDRRKLKKIYLKIIQVINRNDLWTAIT